MDKTTELGNSLPETPSNAMKTLDYGLQYGQKRKPQWLLNKSINVQSNPELQMDLRGLTIKFANSPPCASFIMNLYQLDKQ